MAELSNVPARELDKFIEDHLMVNTAFRTKVREAIHMISGFLKERCFQDSPYRVRVSKVVKGGSSGKGTALRGKSDADLVVFLINLTGFEDQFERRGEFIREIKRQLEVCRSEERFDVEFEIQSLRHERPRALSFTLRSRGWGQEGVEFDVLPAFDILGQWNGCPPSPQIYVQLIRECQQLGKEGEFSPCFTELQRAFLRDRPAKLKSLIRLVKHWFQKCKEKLGKPLPGQYALELLTVYAWECDGRKPYFNTAEGFRTVLELVLNYDELRIYWTEYYDFENTVIKDYLWSQLNKPRPVILDPADPTGNVAGRDISAWARLATEAQAWLHYPCFRNWDGSPVRAWGVQPTKNTPLGYNSVQRFFSQHQPSSSRVFWEHQQDDPPWETSSPWVTTSQQVTVPSRGTSSTWAASASHEEDSWTCTIL